MKSLVFEPPKFLDPKKILFASGISKGQNLADLGAGSGFFVLAAAKIVGDQGSVYAVDILESALNQIAAEGRVQGVRNIKTIRSDLEGNHSCAAIETGSLDYVLLANIIHQLKNPDSAFSESYRMLKTGGKLVVLEWNDEPSPIGPIAASRVSPEKISQLAASIHLKPAGLIPTDNYHYGLVYIK